MQSQWDVIIVGAGPAGMSAAMQCAEEGLEVLVLDRHAHPGGQIWKNVGAASAEKVKFIGSEYAKGQRVVQEFLHSKVTFVSNAQVWNVDKTTLYASIEGESYFFSAKCLVLATGAMERPAPVQGWDLPYVMGVGACDVLLKDANIAPKGPIVICGNGPLILQTVAHLCELKVPIAALILTGEMKKNTWNAFLQSYKAISRPIYFLHGMGYSLQALLKKIPMYYNAKDIAITENNGALVSFTAGKKKHSVQAQTVLVHEGITPGSRITHMLGCRHVWNGHNRYWHAESNTWGETTIDNVFIAGDVGGVSGATAAFVQGNIVGIGICAKLGKYGQTERDAKAKKYRRTLLRCNLMQDFTDAFFTPNPAALIPSDDTIVCRCEEVTAKEIKDAILNGCSSVEAVKIQCRSGMGLCQGRMCTRTVTSMIAEVHGVSIENVKPFKARSPLFPVKMGELAKISTPETQL